MTRTYLSRGDSRDQTRRQVLLLAVHPWHATIPPWGESAQTDCFPKIREVLENYDMECEKVMARLERSAQRRLEAAKTQMEARIQKIPPDVRHIPLQEYYDMHASSSAAERGRYIPPLAMASLPD